ncbi:hypothetical protein SOQ14_00735 [Erythrobacter sp. T5W1-R]|uniref:hypothetical protein n=1 Tax=Erythrobacter sp. T5W1-R TaxID=3101752 RepID=UPI002AFF9E79|nr:hypothetical protein [Erythrobacter sp. T5W1-R]MEA1617438.1 hypothetical protein [Erythrobacter sp. T5W1-R]
MEPPSSTVAHPLAFCRVCGVVFEASAIAFASNITVIGCGTSCAYGHRAEILDGTYTLVDDVLSVLGGSNFTALQVSKLNSLKSEVRKMAMSQPYGLVPEEFTEALKEISPGLGGAWSLASKGKYGWAFFLFFLSMALSRCGDGPLIEINNHTQNNYYIDGSQNPHHPSQQEHSGNSDSPGDGTQTENGKDGGAPDIKFTHASSFRKKLLSSSAIYRA